MTDVYEAIIDELNKFIGSKIKAPSFRGSDLGESEVQYRCADLRTVNWLTMITPKLKPWNRADLKCVAEQEWQNVESRCVCLE